MTHDPDLDLMRLLHGELPAERERALRDRLGRDPGLAVRYRRLEATWTRLTEPPAAPVPLGFGGRLMAHVRATVPSPLPPANIRAANAAAAASRTAPISWAAIPKWVRATGAAALVAGLLLGAGLGVRPPLDDRGQAAGLPALAESYWALLDTAPGDPPPAPPAEATSVPHG